MSAVAEEKQIIKGGAFLIEERAPTEIFTPEDFTEEHRMIADTTRQFVDNEVSPHIDELEKHDWKLARELVAKAAELGLIGANIPEEYGGLGLAQHPLLQLWEQRVESACCPSSTLQPKLRRRNTFLASLQENSSLRMP
jgi:Acyl-CoA dehydrogenase, N-terminal domain